MTSPMPQPILEPVESRRLHAAQGFEATYYDTSAFTRTETSRTDTVIQFDTRNVAPAKHLPQSDFSARWTATVTPTATGRHALYVTADGGVRVWVDDRLVLSRHAKAGKRFDAKAVVPLTAGRAAKVLVEYRHTSGYAYLSVNWLTPGGAKTAFAGAAATPRPFGLSDRMDHGLAYAADQFGATYDTLDPKNGVPVRADAGKTAWTLQPFTDWTSGTFANALWQLNAAYPDAGWADKAEVWTAPLAKVHQPDDVFDREYAAERPALEAGNASAEQVLLDSAALKLTTFNKTVRAFLTPGIVSHSKNAGADFGVLMDQTNDMAELLYAWKETGNASYYDKVVAHMRTVAAHMMRADGSVVQRGYFNPKTGAYVVGENSQGYSDTSTWSRAQAWALDSFTTVAAATGRDDMLAVAQKAATYWLANVPADGIPFWDFAAPNRPHTYRDTSAAAVAADAFVRLSKLTDGTTAATYKQAAETILGSLLSPAYLTEPVGGPGILQHAAYSVPADRSPDASLMFGDDALLIAVNDYRATFAG